ncbi:site-specific integrase [Actinophytocola xinjiangensis]|uniref:Site-specific integrase n=1 Tax=Actinophytocola xinjiangensis TaxID=485602 RepID=A0A7Z1AU70_9PSEU|nr:site-specific integrase [Actinophytocola xinjiangensis]OLF04712.1 site-specific integrase [Actinophytocola xinjiangensis]
MARRKRTRTANGRSTIYLGADGCWHGRVTMGIKDNGKPDRRHIKRKGDGAYDAVVEAVQQLENQRKEGVQPTPRDKSQTVAEWLTYWLEEIARPHIRYKTYEGYENDIRKHLVPHIGAHKMARIQHEPERFEKIYSQLAKAGLGQYTRNHVHITARAAFREAKKRKVITENPFEIVKAPRVEEEEVDPYEVEEVRDILEAALQRRNGARFVLALAIGTRKGESIAFRWSWLNKKTKVLRVRRQRQRHTYEHGCADPAACVSTRHKIKPCRQPCRSHKRKCPPPCRPGCVKHAMHCPERIGGMVDVDVKSQAGRRGVRLPDQLFDLLMDHEKTQAAERELAGDAWIENDFMFTQPNGKPIDPRSDHNEWKALLTAAGVRDARLHDARHTAATVLLILGVPLPVVMEIMGWSNAKVAKRYLHVISTIQVNVAAQLNTLLWGH